MADHTAASASRAHVNTAISGASAGDRVFVPAGTADWTGGVSITGIQLIGAGTSTYPTTSSSGTVITAGTLTITKHATEYTRASGFSFTGTSRHLTCSGTYTDKAFIVDHCYLNTNGGQNADRMLQVDVNGGLFHHCDFYAATGRGEDVVQLATPETDWSVAHTIGSADTTGERNIYFEDCSVTNILETMPDADTGSRLVVRYCTYNDSSIVCHSSAPNDSGSTGAGHRHSEIYNNIFNRVSNSFALNKWLWLRGGTGVFANNSVESADSPDGSSYTGKHEINFTVGCPTGYPITYQVGQVTIPADATPDKPFAVFGNTGTTIRFGLDQGPIVSCATPGDYVQVDRDYVLSNTWGWTAYEYPHPLQSFGEASEETHTPAVLVPMRMIL